MSGGSWTTAEYKTYACAHNRSVEATSGALIRMFITIIRVPFVTVNLMQIICYTESCVITLLVLVTSEIIIGLKVWPLHTPTSIK